VVVVVVVDLWSGMTDVEAVSMCCSSSRLCVGLTD
jgi:hypothetical protein